MHRKAPQRHKDTTEKCSKTKTESSSESLTSAPSPGRLPRPHEAGANLAFTYQGDRLKENVESLTSAAMPGSLLLSCDVTKQEEVDEAFRQVGEKFGRLDFLIHSIAFAPREALGGEYLDTTREAFLTALEISAYSLPQLARAAAPLMTEGGSIVSMTYYGAEKVVAGYNVMGVAKASLEASTRYLAKDLGPRTSASTLSVPVQFKLSRLAAFPISGRCSNTTPSALRSAETSRRAKSEIQQSSFAVRCLRVLPAK